MVNLIDNLTNLLSKDERLVSNNELLKNKVIELAIKLDSDLVKILLSDKKIKDVFFTSAVDTLIFDKDKFIKFISNKQFLPDSYTAFTNKIGLTENGEFISEKKEVVVSWPYKDCVLEGGQTKEDAKRNEVFWNQILAPDEISRLLDPKVFTNAKRIDKTGEHKLENFKTDENGNIKDNLIIKGNNLLALHSLKKRFAGKVKLIYIDPPYYFKDQKESDSFGYNTNFKLSTWLTFMKNRLMIAKDLLSNDGTIFVQINDDGQAYLKVLMDEIFDGNFLNTISVKAKASSGASGGGEDKKMKKNVEFLNVYCKSGFERFNDVFQYILLSEYINDLKDNDKNFSYTSVMVNQGDKKYLKSIKDGRGDEIKIYKHERYNIQSVNQVANENNISVDEVYLKYLDKIFTLENAQTSIRNRVMEATDEDNTFYSIEYIPKSGKNKGKLTEVAFIGKTKRLVSYLHANCEKIKGRDYKKIKVGSLWDDLSWSSVSNEGGVRLKNGKKPEKLIQRIVRLATESSDTVLDFFLASGTTCAVSHKMGRQFIGIEQLDYPDNDSIVRLKNVIKGDQTGISKDENWQGGGDFVYLELAKWNENFVEKIKKVKSVKELAKIWEEIKQKAFLSYKVNSKMIDSKAKDFAELSLKDQKRFLLECLDKNQMYTNYSEINDEDYAISKEDRKINKDFYG